MQSEQKQEQKPEEKLDCKQKSLREISINLEKLDREYHELMTELNLEPHHIKNYIEEPSNFSEPIWELLKNEQKKLDAKLDLSLKSIKDPIKLKKTFSERGSVQPHWIFVR